MVDFLDKMDKEDPCPFPLPIKVELSEHENVDNCGGAWQAKESFPKLRLVRMPKSKQRPARSNVNVSRKNDKLNVKHTLNFLFHCKYFINFMIFFLPFTEKPKNQTNFNRITVAYSIDECN